MKTQMKAINAPTSKNTYCKQHLHDESKRRYQAGCEKEIDALDPENDTFLAFLHVYFIIFVMLVMVKNNNGKLDPQTGGKLELPEVTDHELLWIFFRLEVAVTKFAYALPSNQVLSSHFLFSLSGLFHEGASFQMEILEKIQTCGEENPLLKIFASLQKYSLFHEYVQLGLKAVLQYLVTVGKRNVDRQRTVAMPPKSKKKACHAKEGKQKLAKDDYLREDPNYDLEDKPHCKNNGPPSSIDHEDVLDLHPVRGPSLIEEVSRIYRSAVSRTGHSDAVHDPSAPEDCKIDRPRPEESCFNSSERRDGAPADSRRSPRAGRVASNANSNAVEDLKRAPREIVQSAGMYLGSPAGAKETLGNTVRDRDSSQAEQDLLLLNEVDWANFNLEKLMILGIHLREMAREPSQDQCKIKLKIAKPIEDQGDDVRVRVNQPQMDQGLLPSPSRNSDGQGPLSDDVYTDLRPTESLLGCIHDLVSISRLRPKILREESCFAPLCVDSITQLQSIFPQEERDFAPYPSIVAPFPPSSAYTQPMADRMRYEAFRLRTFQDLPNMPQHSAPRLANAGFFHPAEGQVLQCYSCGLKWGGWMFGGDAFDEHRRLSPTCRHINGQDARNVPIQDHQNQFRSGGDMLGDGAAGRSVTENCATIKLSLRLLQTQIQTSLETGAPNRPQEASQTGSGSGQSRSSGNPTAALAPSQPLRQSNEADVQASNLRMRPPVDVETDSIESHDSSSQRHLHSDDRLTPGNANDRQDSEQTLPERIDPPRHQVPVIPTNPTNPSEDLQGTGSELQYNAQPNHFSREIDNLENALRVAHPESNITQSSISFTHVFRAEIPQAGLADGLYPTRGSNHRENSPTGASDRTPPSNAPLTGTPASARAAPQPRPAGAVGGSTRVVHPGYADRSRRLQSFRFWPSSRAQTPEELADCGFFYTGTGDCVRCFHCGLGLKHWEPGDDPEEEHERWRGSCGFLLQRRNQQTAAWRRALAGHRQDENAASGQASLQHEGETNVTAAQSNLAVSAQSARPLPAAFDDRNWMASRAAVAARDMGFNDDIIQEAILALLQTRAGPRAVTPQNLANAILYMRARGSQERPTPGWVSGVGDLGVSSDSSGASNADDDNDDDDDEISNVPETPTGGSTSHGISGVSDAMTMEGSGDASLEGGKLRGSNDDVISGNKKEPEPSKEGQDKETLLRLEEENKELRERRRCKVCLDRAFDVLLLPCRHLVCCQECVMQLRRCPLCRTRIQNVAPIHFN